MGQTDNDLYRLYDLVHYKWYYYTLHNKESILIFILGILMYMYIFKQLKAYRLSELNFFLILKVANIRCFILIAVEIVHNIIRK
jgi:hypothetical protein